MAAPVSPAATVSPDMSASTSPWASSLPDDLVRLVASRLLDADVVDYVRLRAVCAAWRSSTASPRFHPRRWMMLPEGHGLYPGHPRLQGYVRFFHLDTGALLRVRVPLFEDHCVLDSFQGLLVLQRDGDTVVRLLHPFTGDVLDLPHPSPLCPHRCTSTPTEYDLHDGRFHISDRSLRLLPSLRMVLSP